MVKDFLNKMWQDYVSFNPEAENIYNSFKQRGEMVVNDHIALRTFKHPLLGLEQLAKPFVKMGYVEKGEYFFKEKKLYAKHFENPSDATLPKIFISELEIEKFSSQLRNIVDRLVQQIPEADFYRNDFSFMGRPWNLSHTDYLALAEESEYAGWMGAIGFRPNHFTVSVNHLTTFKNLLEVNQFLKKDKFTLNSSGGEIKGSPEDFLEQSSTMAGTTLISFSDGNFSVPTCYYEFALRYPLKDGSLYQGFVAKSADKIFESTNRTK